MFSLTGCLRLRRRRLGRSRVLNIFSILSVSRNPPTTLIVEATTAMKPRMSE